jgi:hypothetical protein
MTSEDSDRALIVEALEQVGWVVGGPRGAAAKLGLRRATLLAKMRGWVSRGLFLWKKPALPESRKKMFRLESRTGSRTWNKVRSQQARTARAAKPSGQVISEPLILRRSPPLWYLQSRLKHAPY